MGDLAWVLVCESTPEGAAAEVEEAQRLRRFALGLEEDAPIDGKGKRRRKRRPFLLRRHDEKYYALGEIVGFGVDEEVNSTRQTPMVRLQEFGDKVIIREYQMIHEYALPFKLADDEWLAFRGYFLDVPAAALQGHARALAAGDSPERDAAKVVGVADLEQLDDGRVVITHAEQRVDDEPLVTAREEDAWPTLRPPVPHYTDTSDAFKPVELNARGRRRAHSP